MSNRGSALKREPELEPPASGETAGSRRLRWLLTVCCVSQFMVILDLTIVNVALPNIQASLGFSQINLQWVIIAYAIVFAGFLMLGGRAADQLGQRRTLAAGLVLFALASLVGGASVSQPMLISARAVQGLSGALMAAASLATITSSFPQGPARHRAIGLWGAMNGAGGAAGALFGGIITQEWGWRWVLLINPPIGIAAAAVAWWCVVDRPTKRAGKFDILGAVTLTASLMIIAWGVVNASAYGLTTRYAIGPIIVGIVLSVLFPLIEKRASDPLVPLEQFTKPLRRANLVVLLFSMSLFPMWYLGSLYLQQVLGLSPLKAGLTFFPMAVIIMITARQAGKLVSLWGARAVLGSGLILLTSGLLLFARIGPSGSPIGFVVLPGLLVAAGIGLSIVPSTIVATMAAGRENAGLASGLVNTSRQIGGSLGIALLISIATAYTSAQIGANVGVPLALTEGFRIGYLIAAGAAAAAAACAFTLLPPMASPEQRARRGLRLPVGVVAVLAVFAIIDFVFAGAPGAPIGQFTTSHTISYVSAPGLHPPAIKASITGSPSQLARGDILLTNFYDVTRPPMAGQSGPLILNNKLQPVWFQPVPTSVVASNLSEQTYQGKPVLAWWQGVVTSTGAISSGEYVIVNQHYQRIATLTGKDGWVPTLHTLLISGDDAWVTANKNISMNLARYGGSVTGALTDSAVQEYNLTTGRLLYTWDAMKHIPLSDSHANPPPNGFPYDAYHVNSISLAGGNQLLVSMRNTWAAYLINTRTSQIEWTLGGKHSSFHIPGDAKFEWQHDVTIHGDTVSMFNDDCCQITGAGVYLSPAGPSRGLILKVDAASHTVTKVAEYGNKNMAAAYMGSVESLPNGNVFMGWGQLPYFDEYTHSGKLLLEGTFPAPDMSYRAKQIPSWTGLPLTKPSGAARTSGGKTTVYASWNGATQVHSWRLLAGASPSSLRPLTTKTKGGFETHITVSTSAKAFQLVAVDASGKVIGTSKVFGIGT